MEEDETGLEEGKDSEDGFLDVGAYGRRIHVAIIWRYLLCAG